MHEAIVGSLQARTRGFRKAVIAAVGSPGAFPWWRRRPDAYEIRHRQVVAYEVEDTHRIDDAKWADYGRLWRELDDLGWELTLVIRDLRGGVYEPDLELVRSLFVDT
jgi:hypothetical protein